MLSSSSLIFFSIKISWPWLLFGGGGGKIPGFSMLQKHYSIQKMQYALNFNPLNCLTGHFKTKISFENIDTKKITQLKWEYLPMEYSHLLLRLWSAPVPTFHCMVMAKDLKLLKSSFRIIGFFHHPGKS